MWLLAWLFSPDVALWIIALGVGGGLTLALAPRLRNIRLAHIFFGFAWVWALGCILEGIMKSSMSLKASVPLAFLAGGIIAVLALLSHYWVEQNRKEANPASSTSKPDNLATNDSLKATVKPAPAIAAKDTSRVMSRLTPLQLAQIYEQRTTVEADKLAEVHVGTWLPVSGSVYDIWGDKQKPWMAIHLDGFTIVICSFRQEWYQRTAILQKGDQVKIIGKILKFDSTKIELEECEVNN